MVPTLLIMVPRVLSQIEGAQGPNFAVDGEGRRRSTQRLDPIERLVPGANNIQGYPETVWKSDADGRLERFNL